MKLPFKTTNFKMNESVANFLSRRMEKMEELLGKIGGVVSGWIELGRTTRHHKKGDVYRAEAQIKLKSQSIRAEGVSNTVFGAITQMKDRLKRELSKYKTRKPR
ncbi:MAG: HPF/RaiA family ribosome-associated protein [Candidatus Wildermuthbacteria bacterium]|nr:HPF/RaiA family ribosome-associated protein [Candidatus Wildermuthbacteria bacterium]